MELNPALDVRNRTAELAVDLIESLFGKSTLMRRLVGRWLIARLDRRPRSNANDTPARRRWGLDPRDELRAEAGAAARSVDGSNPGRTGSQLAAGVRTTSSAYLARSREPVPIVS